MERALGIDDERQKLRRKLVVGGVVQPVADVDQALPLRDCHQALDSEANQACVE